MSRVYGQGEFCARKRDVKKGESLRKPSQRTVTVIASALGALVVALPVRSFAQRYPYRATSGWGHADPYAQRYYDDDDYNRPYYGEPQDGEGQGWWDWWGIQHEREEIEQARAARRRDWQNLQHERREMDEARRAGDWDEYREEQREAEQAANAVRRDQGQIEHEQYELRQQQRALRHHRHDWDED